VVVVVDSNVNTVVEILTEVMVETIEVLIVVV
jgi:hypothetical protein